MGSGIEELQGIHCIERLGSWEKILAFVAGRRIRERIGRIVR
jgi:hypothetical protein